MRSLSFPAAVAAAVFDAASFWAVAGFEDDAVAGAAVGVVVVGGAVVEVIIVLELLFVELLVTTMVVGAGIFDAFIIGLICVDPILMGTADGIAIAAAAAFAAAAFCCFMEAGVACRTVKGRDIVGPDARI